MLIQIFITFFVLKLIFLAFYVDNNLFLFRENHKMKVKMLVRNPNDYVRETKKDIFKSKILFLFFDPNRIKSNPKIGSNRILIKKNPILDQESINRIESNLDQKESNFRSRIQKSNRIRILIKKNQNFYIEYFSNSCCSF